MNKETDDCGFLEFLGDITGLMPHGDFLYVSTASEWYEVSGFNNKWRILPEGSD